MALVVALLLHGRLAVGQLSPRGQSTCPANPAPTAVDTAVDTLFAWIPNRRRGEAEDEYTFRASQVRAVLSFLGVLPVLGAPTSPVLSGPQDPVGMPRLRDAKPLVWFQVRNDGRLSGLALEHRSWWHTLDMEVAQAILRADSARALPSLPPSLAGQAIDLWLAIGTTRLDSATNIPIARYRHLAARAASVETRPRLLSVGHRPRFPSAAVASGIGDSLVVEFVVDTSGRVDSSSIVLVRATYREFATEAIRSIMSTRFSPGTIDGCPVRARIRWPINFVITSS